MLLRLRIALRDRPCSRRWSAASVLLEPGAAAVLSRILAQPVLRLSRPAERGEHQGDRSETVAFGCRLAGRRGSQPRGPVSNVAYVGYGGPRFFVPLAPRDEDPHVAFMLVTVDSDRGGRPLVLERTRRSTPRRKSPRGLRPSEEVLPRQLRDRPAGGADARPRCSRRWPMASVKQVEAALRAVPGILDVHNNWENRITKLHGRDRPGAGAPRRRHLRGDRPKPERLLQRRSGHRLPRRRPGDPHRAARRAMPSAPTWTACAPSRSIRLSRGTQRAADRRWPTSCRSTSTAGSIATI